MKNWNRTGKIKAIILGLLSILNIVAPQENMFNPPIHMILGPLLFGLVAIPISTAINVSIFDRIISKPTWNESPFVIKRPLNFFHFGAYFFLVAGVSTLLGGAIKFQQLNLLGLIATSFGIGILGGIYLTLRFKKTEQ